MTSSRATVVHGAQAAVRVRVLEVARDLRASPSTADGTARPSLRRQARNAVAVTSSQPVPTSQPGQHVETK